MISRRAAARGGFFPTSAGPTSGMVRRMSHAGGKRFLAAGVLLLVALLAPTEAAAHDRPMYAGFGGGPYLNLDCCRVHGRLTGEFGFHFSRNDTGFLIAFEAMPTFGDDFFFFLGGVRFGGDIEVYGRHEYAIMLRPSALVGFGWFDLYGGNPDWGVFVVQPAFDFRFVFAHRVLALWVRPVAFDFIFFFDRGGRDLYWTPSYQFLLGLDFQFG